MKKTYTFAAAGVVAILLAVCSVTGFSGCPDLPEAQKEALITEANAIFTVEATAAPAGAVRYLEIDVTRHPHLSGLSPKKVTLQGNGLYIRMKEGFVTECGYFIPSTPDNEADLTRYGDPSYKKQVAPSTSTASGAERIAGSDLSGATAPCFS